MTKKIAGFGDGPACFNCEMTNAGGNVVSFDPIYQFSKEEIEERIEEVRITVMQQMREDMYFMSCQPDCHMNQKVLILA